MNTEEKAIGSLLNRSESIVIPKRSILRYIGKKERKFEVRQSCLGTLYEISSLAVKMNFDESVLMKDPFFESKVLVTKHARTMSLVVAIAILNSKWKIRLFSKMLSGYLFWRINPEMMLKIVILIGDLNNISDFINSIRSIRGWRMTQPKSEMSPAGNGG